MKFQGYRIPDGQIRDMTYIAHETGMSKSAMVRQGLAHFINTFFEKEKIKQEQIRQQHQRTQTINTHRDENWIPVPDW